MATLLQGLRRPSFFRGPSSQTSPPSLPQVTSDAPADAPAYTVSTQVERLSLERKDYIFAYQSGLKDFKSISDPFMLVIAHICWSRRNAANLWDGLLKHNLLTPRTYLPNTSVIVGKKIPRQFPSLTLGQQRDMVDMLFWWDLEVKRFEHAEEMRTRFERRVHDVLVEAETELGRDVIEKGKEVCTEWGKRLPSKREINDSEELDRRLDEVQREGVRRLVGEEEQQRIGGEREMGESMLPPTYEHAQSEHRMRGRQLTPTLNPFLDNVGARLPNVPGIGGLPTYEERGSTTLIGANVATT